MQKTDPFFVCSCEPGFRDFDPPDGGAFRQSTFVYGLDREIALVPVDAQVARVGLPLAVENHLLTFKNGLVDWGIDDHSTACKIKRQPS
jgi:hypothetical protein